MLRDLEILEIRADGTVWAALNGASPLQSGQYLHTWQPGDLTTVSGRALFLVESESGWDGPPVDGAQVLRLWGWGPGLGVGERLQARGALGQPLRLPNAVRRLAVTHADGLGFALLPLIHQALAQGASVAVFANQPAGELPLEVEINPQAGLKDASAWADYLLAELPVDGLGGLRGESGLRRINGQVLVHLPMPCAGAAACGVCAISPGSRKDVLLLCKDGPALDLRKVMG